MKKCPFCAEEVQDEAAKCRHCQRMLNEGISIKQPVTKQERSLAAKVGNVIGILIALGSFTGLLNPGSFGEWLGSLGGLLFGLTVTDFYMPLFKNLSSKNKERIRVLLPIAVIVGSFFIAITIEFAKQ